MDIKDYYKAGFIMRPHGLKGEVTISLEADSPADWESIETVMIDVKGRLLPYFITSVSIKGNKGYLKLDEVDNPEVAGQLKGCSLFLLKETRPKLERGDFYSDEIIGFEVEDEFLGLLGEVKTIELAGVTRFIIVNYNGKEVMIPAHQPLLKSINKSKKKITVSLPDGFLDI
jgi:16S rRNA processing protein RimM